MTSIIQILAERVLKARGLEYQIVWKALHDYVLGLSEVEFKEEMTRVDNPGILGVLWSVGLRKAKQDISIKRWVELEGGK